MRKNIYAHRVGFTLVELLVVIAIIGVLVGLLLPAVQSAREAARRMQCSNNLKQLGLAVHNYESTYRRLPSGWVASTLYGEPGWGWAAALLPFMEGSNIANRIDSRFPIDDTMHDSVRVTNVPSFICPSDIGDTIFEIAADSGVGNALNVDAGQKLFRIAKGNYTGVFGTFELEDAPYSGDGMFFGNSRIKFRDVLDGLSNTLMISEHGSRLGGTVWHGYIPEAAEAAARIVGVADHGPNDPIGHFEDFSSFHTAGVNAVNADGSVRLMPNSIDLRVYQALATRSGGEVVSYVD